MYNEPEKRFKDGCQVSAQLGLDDDYFPGDPRFIVYTEDSLELLFWKPSKCEDGKLRPLGIEECTFIWNVELNKYEGECTYCGKCCGDCKYLREGPPLDGAEHENREAV